MTNESTFPNRAQMHALAVQKIVDEIRDRMIAGIRGNQLTVSFTFPAACPKAIMDEALDIVRSGAWEVQVGTTTKNLIVAFVTLRAKTKEEEAQATPEPTSGGLQIAPAARDEMVARIASEARGRNRLQLTSSPYPNRMFREHVIIAEFSLPLPSIEGGMIRFPGQLRTNAIGTGTARSWRILNDEDEIVMGGPMNPDMFRLSTFEIWAGQEIIIDYFEVGFPAGVM